MCNIHIGAFSLNFEIPDGRIAKSEDIKTIHVNFINNTGGIKFIIDSNCISNYYFINVSLNGSNANSKSANHLFFAKPSYFKPTTFCFYAHLNNFPCNTEIELDCTINLIPIVHPNDDEAKKLVNGMKKIIDFHPPLRVA